MSREKEWLYQEEPRTQRGFASGVSGHRRGKNRLLRSKTRYVRGSLITISS
jgi:hypothetical protein